MCSKGSSNGSSEGLSVETANAGEDLRHFLTDTFPQLFQDAPHQTRLRVVHARWRSVLCQYN